MPPAPRPRHSLPHLAVFLGSEVRAERVTLAVLPSPAGARPVFCFVFHVMFCFAVVHRPPASSLPLLFRTELPKMACGPFRGHVTEFGREACGEVLPPGGAVKASWPLSEPPSQCPQSICTCAPSPAPPRLQTRCPRFRPCTLRVHGFRKQCEVCFCSRYSIFTDPGIVNSPAH